MENIFLARQPIFNRDQEVYGYELLYRDSDINAATIDDDDLASSQVIINAFINMGMENIVGSSLAFINVPRNFLVDKQLLPMTSEQVALEVLETVAVDEDVIDGLKELSAEGFLIVLDDFVYRESLKPLLAIADIVKLDLMLLSDEEVKEHVKKLAAYDVKLLAEKVETSEQYDLCVELGFDYFQGYHFCKPSIIKGKDVAVNKTVVFQIISKLQDPDMSMEELEKLLVQDVTLTYKLLRYINSASFAFRKEIESIKQALVIIGVKTMRNWATLIILSTVNSDKPFELIRLALVRGKMAELLAEKTGKADKDQMFTVGLFSLLDAVMDIEMIDLLDTISLTAPIKMALLYNEGELGDILQQVTSYEKGDWQSLKDKTDDTAIYKECYIGALRWADEISHTLRGKNPGK